MMRRKIEAISDLDDVSTPSPGDGDGLVWSDANSRWEASASGGAESDPVFVASAAYGIVAGDITNWDTAYGWGDHSGLYDPAGTMTTHESTYNHANYDTAYGWGDHSGLYESSGAVATHEGTYNHANYDTAYGWGDHAGLYEDAGDITTHAALDTGVHGAGVDTLATDADIATHAAITAAHHAKYTDAEAVTAIKGDADWNAANWDTAYGWGDHSGLYESSGAVATHESTYNHANYDTAYGWGDHSGMYESSGSIATHAALDTGIHGAGTDVLATDADIVTHAAIAAAHHVKYLDSEAVAAIKADADWNATEWDTAYDWGDHAGLYESSGAVTTHESTYNHANYDTAYGWGDHSGLYETSGSIATHAALDTGVHGAGADVLATDADIATHTAIVAAHHAKYTDAEAITAIKGDADWNATDWDTAYGWGDHSGLYESSGAVTTHESTYNHANYNTAYGWGDHSGLYSLTSHTHDSDTLQLDAINSDGGSFSFNTTGAVAFNQNVYIGSNAPGESWSGTFDVIEIGGNAALVGSNLAGGGKVSYYMQNAYYDGSWKRQDADEATRYLQSGGGHLFYTAAYGAADSVISWTILMEMDRDGLVGIGRNTIAGARLVVEGTVKLDEVSLAGEDSAGYGQLWVKSDTPNTLWFTDDVGTDVRLGVTLAHTHDGDTLQLDGINSDGGSFAFTTSGDITFNHDLIIPSGGTIGSLGDPDAITIENSGFVGIGMGATATSYRLEIRENAASYVAYLFNDGNNNLHMGMGIQAGKDDGSGTNYFIRAFDGNASETGRIITVAGAFQLVDVSDSVLKNVHGDSEFNALNRIRALKVKNWEWKKSPGKFIDNFLADEVSSVVPEAASQSPEDGIWAYSRGMLVPTLWKAAQEADSERAIMRQEINDLRKQDSNQGKVREAL